MTKKNKNQKRYLVSEEQIQMIIENVGPNNSLEEILKNHPDWAPSWIQTKN